MKKIYLFMQESNVDGEIMFNVVPCSTKEKAKKLLEAEKQTIINDGYHYKGYTEEDLEENFVIEKSEDRWFIKDPNDDYYEDLWVEEKEVL